MTSASTAQRFKPGLESNEALAKKPRFLTGDRTVVLGPRHAAMERLQLGNVMYWPVAVPGRGNSWVILLVEDSSTESILQPTPVAPDSNTTLPWPLVFSHVIAIGGAEEGAIELLPQCEEDISCIAREVFAAGKSEFFEDGIESQFSSWLISFIARSESDALRAISSLILDAKVAPGVAAEALRWIGRIVQSDTYQQRLWLLEQSLESSSPVIRDGAILGLASMDDSHAVPALVRALERETSVDLKHDIQQVIDQLRTPANR